LICTSLLQLSFNIKSITKDADIFGIPSEEALNEKTATTTSIDYIRHEIETILLLPNSSLPVPPNKTLAAFIHIGKTGGSSIAVNLRNGCHSWLPKPCKREKMLHFSADFSTPLSKLSTYYHTPDFDNSLLFDNLQRQQHQIVVITLRDPFDRIVSAFLYQHPKNQLLHRFVEYKKTIQYHLKLSELGSVWAVFQFREQKLKAKQEFQKEIEFFKCLPSLEIFATLLNTSSNNHSSKTWEQASNTGDCATVAQLAIHQQPDNPISHFRWGLQSIVKEGNLDQYLTLLIRTEHLEDDWISANQFFEPKKVILLPQKKLRDSNTMNFPVKKELSPSAQKILCKALEGEYKIYFQLLERALNLNEKEKAASMKYSQQKCPSLKLSP